MFVERKKYSTNQPQTESCIWSCDQIQLNFKVQKEKYPAERKGTSLCFFFILKANHGSLKDISN